MADLTICASDPPASALIAKTSSSLWSCRANPWCPDAAACKVRLRPRAHSKTGKSVVMVFFDAEAVFRDVLRQVVFTLTFTQEGLANLCLGLNCQ